MTQNVIEEEEEGKLKMYKAAHRRLRRSDKSQMHRASSLTSSEAMRSEPVPQQERMEIKWTAEQSDTRQRIPPSERTPIDPRSNAHHVQTQVRHQA